MKQKSHFLIIIFICIFGASSCIKKYSCKCTTTLSAQGYYPKETVTVQEIKKKSSKKKAKQICNNTAQQLSTNTKALYDESVGVNSTCAIKEY